MIRYSPPWKARNAHQCTQAGYRTASNPPKIIPAKGLRQMIGDRFHVKTGVPACVGGCPARWASLGKTICPNLMQINAPPSVAG